MGGGLRTNMCGVFEEGEHANSCASIAAAWMGTRQGPEPTELRGRCMSTCARNAVRCDAL
eukprot:6806325-Prymnesium_polylepis.1